MNVQKSFDAGDGRGTLYLVATPIGNLEDITYRAVRVLSEADWIAAEDTRQTRKLLAHCNIEGARLVSYHEHNKRASGPELIRRLQAGESVALVSDAGVPAISDPGRELVRDAAEAGIPVVPVPGANAALSALIVSGLPTERFLFIGFLPREKKRLAEELEALRRTEATIVCYESPHRIEKTIGAMLDAWGNRPVALARELTKRHEEVFRGSLSEAARHLKVHPPLGEYVIVAGGAGTGGNEPEESGEADWRSWSVAEHVARWEAELGDRKEAMKRAAAERGVSKRDIYRALLEDKEED